jgi:hypothetical protein
LFSSLALFFAKEAVQKVAVRELDDNRSANSSINLMVLALPINFLIIGILTCILILFGRPSTNLEFFIPSIICFGAFLVLDCYADIYYVYMVLQKDLSIRLKVESFA